MTRKHLILMAIGCLLPIAGLAAIFLFQVQVSTVVLIGMFLLCPALHLWMMRAHLGRADARRAERPLLADEGASHAAIPIGDET